MTPESNHWQQFIQSLTDKGRAENAVEVQTRYSFTRKVAEPTAFWPRSSHVFAGHPFSGDAL